MKTTALRAAMSGLLLTSAAFVPAAPAKAIFLMATSAERIAALETERQSLLDASQAIVDGLEDGVDMTDEQTDAITANTGKIGKIDAQITALQSLAPKSQGRKTSPENGLDPKNPKVPAAPRANDRKHGLRSFGEFAIGVRALELGMADGEAAKKVLAAATTYGNEGTGTDGGFAVPPDFRTEIWQKVMDQENLLPRCSQLTTGGNSITIPKDETTPWQTSGGIQAYWEAEAAVVTASKPALEMSQIRLAKLMALVPVSDELLEDATGLESWLRAKAPAKMAAKINTAIVRGTGVGQPLGMLNAGCLVSVAKETSQPASTIYFANINKMWARMYAPCRRNAIWLINQDIEPQLDAMAFDPAATSKVPVYLPPGGVSNADYATLKGRPVVPIEACSTLSTQGDIILADLTQYWAITKGADVRQDVSMHLYFDQGLQAFRFTFRVNGQPIWGSTVSPENGSNTRSCFVTLDAR